MNVEISDDYRQSHQGDNFGREYQKTLEFAWQRMLIRFERNYLAEMFKRLSRSPSELSCLDFACGTGRVLSFLRTYSDDVTGVDISPDMLEVCKEHNPDSNIICADLTTSTAALEGKQFDVITAFRFFPNAQPELREAVMQVLMRHLKPGGILIFNNHRNTGSALFSIARWIGREMPSMSVYEARQLIESAALKVKGKKGFGVLPATNQYFLAPEWTHRIVDGVFSILGLNELLAQDTLYVCHSAAEGKDSDDG